nr:MAG TPA: minor tail protein [Caudoviricetes sp.]
MHEKELVLNQEDTKNILAAVSAMRAFGPSFIASIEKTLDGNALSISSIMASRLGTNT